jgi:hypothetical protein
MRRRKDQREATTQEGLAAGRRALEERVAAKGQAEEATNLRSAVEAELDQHLFRFELAYRLRTRLCVAPARCTNHRCRRLGRCRELAKTQRRIEVCRAQMTAERQRAAPSKGR